MLSVRRIVIVLSPVHPHKIPLFLDATYLTRWDIDTATRHMLYVYVYENILLSPRY